MKKKHFENALEIEKSISEVADMFHTFFLVT